MLIAPKTEFLHGGEIVCEEGKIRIRGVYAVLYGDMVKLEIKDTILEELDNDVTFSEDICNRIVDYIRTYEAARLSVTLYTVNEEVIHPFNRALFVFKKNTNQQDRYNPFIRSKVLRKIPASDSLIRNFLKFAVLIPPTALFREPVVIS